MLTTKIFNFKRPTTVEKKTKLINIQVRFTPGKDPKGLGRLAKQLFTKQEPPTNSNLNHPIPPKPSPKPNTRYSEATAKLNEENAGKKRIDRELHKKSENLGKEKSLRDKYPTKMPERHMAPPEEKDPAYESRREKVKAAILEKKLGRKNREGDYVLTDEGKDCHRVKEAKSRLKKPIGSEETNKANNSESDENLKKNESFVAGQVYYDKREVSFATHVQSHIAVGKEDPETGTVVVTTILTSSKGNKTGIAGCSTSTYLSPNQPFSNDPNKAQYGAHVIPPVKVDQSLFTHNERATDYANTPDVQKKLEEMYRVADKVYSVPYKQDGYTVDDLEDILEVKKLLEASLAQNTQNKNEKPTTENTKQSSEVD